jgi:hypothetical protein
MGNVGLEQTSTGRNAMGARTSIVAGAAFLVLVMVPALAQASYYEVTQMTSGSGGKDYARINNAGEIVWSGGSGGVYSSVRGYIGPGIEPSISNTGEIVWLASDTQGRDLYSSTRGRLTFDGGLEVNSGQPDINASGEAVYIQKTGSYDQVWSTVLGQVTSDSTDHSYPCINDLGEILWSQKDTHGNHQVFSSTRGQLTFDSSSYQQCMDLNNNGEYSYTDSYGKSSPHIFSSAQGIIIPDSTVFQWGGGMDDAGRIVFTAYPTGESPQNQVFMATLVPEPASACLLLLGGLAILGRIRGHHTN